MSDPFSLLGVAPRFDLDLKELEKRHRDLSRTLHPDRHSGAPPAQRRRVLDQAIEVNEAWRCLKDPIRRAEALCAHMNIPVDESSYPPAAPDFLMEIMTQREALAVAKQAGDLHQVEQLRALMEERQAQCLAAIEQAFESASGKSSEHPQLVKRVGELRYFRRFLDEASAIEDELL